MGIDAKIVVRYRGEKPTDDQLTRWSWDMCRAVGAKHFFISDGLPALEYFAANTKWHADFKAHPSYEEWNRLREEMRGHFLRTDKAQEDAAEAARKQIIATIGEPPKIRRRAIDFSGCSSIGYADNEAEASHAERNLGMLYTQDGDDVLAAPGEWLLDVSLWSRYYGKGYERGDLLTLCAVAEWCEVNLQPCEVWYGGDSSGVELSLFDDAVRSELRRHLYGDSGRSYYNYSGSSGSTAHPQPCGLCVPGENRFQQFGTGANYVAVSCGGCGKSFESRDGGETWAEQAKDRS